VKKPPKSLADPNQKPAQAVHQALGSSAKLAGHQLILVLHGKELSAWQVDPTGKPKSLPIKDEARLSVPSLEKLESALADIAERLRGDGVVVAHTHWIADAAGRAWCAACATQTEPLANWQLLGWEWLADRFGLGSARPRDAVESFTDVVLPWLISADDAVQRQSLRRARENEHLSEADRLKAERAALEKENQHLRDQNGALQQVNLERLVSFLPALFPRVFTVLGPADVALLCGRVEPPSLPNPFPEPSEETLRTLQRRFRALPMDQQRQFVRFVAALPQRQKLEPRPEMREWVQELEGC
jgi:hypothetical protein